MVGQWHLRVFRPALTSMMNRFGRETMVPLRRGLGNRKTGEVRVKIGQVPPISALTTAVQASAQF